MDAFPTLASKQYNELRHDIRSGDILLCSGNSVFSTLIQKATNSIWSHVAFVLRLDAINRIMLLESVESIGVRAIPLSNYIRDYNGTRKSYPGRIMLARHAEIKDEKIANLSRSAVDLFGYPYGKDEIIRIAARISMHSLGLPISDSLKPTREYICSEYAHTCFKSVGIHIDFNEMGFIAPADFARHPKVKPLCFIDTETRTTASNAA